MGMKIGLIDVDGHNGHPNLALMKISAWHKKQGDHVEWWNGLEEYDKVYMSKVFTFTPDMDHVIRAKEIIRGGTGYKDYKTVLPDEVENIFPDYSLYPHYPSAIGFLTRGCINKCPWCVVPLKEGYIRPAATWQQIKRSDSREIIFLDNNVLACDHGIHQIEDMGGKPVWVDFNQGLDASFIDKSVAKLLKRLHWIRFIRVSCDTKSRIDPVETAVNNMKEAGISPSRFWSYVLVRDNVDEALERVYTLKRLGVTPFAQPYRDYDGGEPPQWQKDFARWVNNKAIYNSCTWDEYRCRRQENL